MLFAEKFGISAEPLYSAVIRINCWHELLYSGLEICLETAMSYQSTDRNFLSDFVYLQNMLSVKLIRSLETYYLVSKELILKVSMFAVEGDIFTFKPSCDSFSAFLLLAVLHQNRGIKAG